MGEPTRLRAVLAIAVACAVLVVSAIGYLRLWPMRFATPRPASSVVVVSQPATVRLQDLEVVSGRTAWAYLVPVPFGASIVLATNDAGRTWRKLPVPASVGGDEKLGLQVIDETHAMLRVVAALLLAAGILYLACSWFLTPLVLVGGVFAVMLGFWAIPLYFVLAVAALGWSASRRVG